ncbi:LytR/AlgR family response regulator transcription factor [Aquibacillus rhizosphaerae]|uniref:LytTR family DNA-binding domain-containing protein n=1 Tax=Aquibacillus rhizosphaerae TaxID=3051431 RepID=A0ABT7LA23_9BACI|nr:LytTR family DNA-binding domain-containing protein [Aquibacillus sp. LR5S19]MDL4842702.1 LytTR family DNA-binding domain-containing protein [Aquibacillus sp. LR5S19]
MTETIRTLIVDDERYAREELLHLLSRFTSIQIIGEADSGEAAIIKALQHQPDVVFLDVEMPKMNGMQSAQSLLELKKPPLIVFATAYPQFAAEAFRYEATDYLLKPYDEEQLQQTIKRIEKKCLVTPKESNKSLSKLAVDVEGEILYIVPNDILYMYREDKVTKITTNTGVYSIKTPLKELENRLVSFSFFRIHKGYLVNLDYVSKLSPWFNGAYQLELKGSNEKLAVSRNYVKSLRQILEL